MNNANSRNITIENKTQGYCTYKTVATSVHPRVHNAQINHTMLTYSAGSTFGSKLSDKLLQYIKQINTYSTYIENEG